MSNAKFRIWATIGWSYRYALNNVRLIFQVGWVPMIGVLIGMLSVPYFVARDVEVPNEVYMVLAMLAGSYFAVRWHRALLLGERNSSPSRFGRLEATYFVAVAVIAGLQSGAASLSISEDYAAVSALLTFALLLPALLLIGFLTAILPAIAVADKVATPLRVWRLWRGNRVRYCAFVLLEQVIGLTVFALAVELNSFVGLRLLDLFDVDLGKAKMFGPDLGYFVLAMSGMAPVLTTVLFFLFAAFIGGLSVAYAGVTRRAVAGAPAVEPAAVRRRTVV